VPYGLTEVVDFYDLKHNKKTGKQATKKTTYFNILIFHIIFFLSELLN